MKAAGEQKNLPARIYLIILPRFRYYGCLT
jgi:hypothetical protein